MTWRKRNVKVPMQAVDAVLQDAEPCSEPYDVDAAADPTTAEPGIGQSVHIQGELTGHEDVTVEGRVDGRITVQEHSLTVAPTGVIHAEVRARSVLVEGQVVGNITADDRVEIAESGSVIGDIRAARVVLAEGARFRGSIDMGLDVADLDGEAGGTAHDAPGEMFAHAAEEPRAKNGHASASGGNGRIRKNATAAATATASGTDGSETPDAGFGTAAGNALASLFGDASTQKVGA